MDLSQKKKQGLSTLCGQPLKRVASFTRLDVATRLWREGLKEQGFERLKSSRPRGWTTAKRTQRKTRSGRTGGQYHACRA